ncbi:MAG: GtrA family protein [Dehalococcoidia bacterium]|nr:GtrA family protein [Dehalococcoidia bacterium]
MRALGWDSLAARRRRHLPGGGLTARAGRFALVGGACGLAQLALLHGFVTLGAEEHLANLAGFALSVQLNFFLSQFFTWRDRWSPALGRSTMLRRLALFNGSATSTGLLNMGAFAVLNVFISYLPAAAAGIGVAAVTNFALNDRLVFRRTRRIEARPSLLRSDEDASALDRAA